MQVTSIILHVSTSRILPEGKCEKPNIFHIKEVISRWKGSATYAVTVSQFGQFEALHELHQLADEYEASQVVLEDDFSTL